MPLTDDDRRLFDRMNKRMDKFDKMGVSNNIIDMVRAELSTAYLGEQEREGTDLSRTNFNKFSMNSHMSETTLNELRGLANALNKSESSKMSYYTKNPDITERTKKTYETLRGKEYGVNDFQSFINFIDDRREAVNSKMINSLLNSKQWARIYGYGKDSGLDTEKINEIIETNMKNYTNGDTFVLFIFNEIDKQYGGEGDEG